MFKYFTCLDIGTWWGNNMRLGGKIFECFCIHLQKYYVHLRNLAFSLKSITKHLLSPPKYVRSLTKLLRSLEKIVFAHKTSAFTCKMFAFSQKTIAFTRKFCVHSQNICFSLQIICVVSQNVCVPLRNLPAEAMKWSFPTHLILIISSQKLSQCKVPQGKALYLRENAKALKYNFSSRLIITFLHHHHVPLLAP